MKIRNLLNGVFACALTVSVLYSVSVREVHYLFAHDHAEQEHCENHLHSKDAHTDCALCKSDVASFTDDLFHLQLTELYSYSKNITGGREVAILSPQSCSNLLRGPPVSG